MVLKIQLDVTGTYSELAMHSILCYASWDVQNKYQKWPLPLRNLQAHRKDDVFMKHILQGKIRYHVCAKVSGTWNNTTGSHKNESRIDQSCQGKLYRWSADKDTNIPNPELFLEEIARSTVLGYQEIMEPPVSERKFVQYENGLILFNKYLLSTWYVPTLSDEVKAEESIQRTHVGSSQCHLLLTYLKLLLICVIPQPVIFYHLPFCLSKRPSHASFSLTATEIGTEERRLAWLLCKDDRQILENKTKKRPSYPRYFWIEWME